jgi:dienelactone hydrolase
MRLFIGIYINKNVGKIFMGARLGVRVVLIALVTLLTGCINDIYLPCDPEQGDTDCDPLASRGAYKVYTSKDFEIDTSSLTIDGRWEKVKNMNGKLYIPSDSVREPMAIESTNFPADGFPLVIMLHGFGVDASWYDSHSRHLASHGIMVLALNYSDAQGVDGRHDLLAEKISLAIDWALAGVDENGGLPTSPFYGLTDGQNRVAIMGHSQGGKTAFYTAYLDSRVKAVIAMDPSNSGGAPCFISPGNCHNYPVAPSMVENAAGELEFRDPGLLKDIHQDLASLIIRAAPSFTNPESVHNAETFFWGTDGEGSCAIKGPALYLDRGNSGHASFVFLNSRSVLVSKQMSVAWIQHYFLGMNRDEYFGGAPLSEYLANGTLENARYRAANEILSCVGH